MSPENVSPKNDNTRLGPGAGAFAGDLYGEHLDEASFLYQRWWYVYENPRIPWDELNDVAARLDRHLDALASGGEDVLELCRVRTEDATAPSDGDVYAAVLLYCRHGRFDRFAKLAVALKPDDEACAKAIEDALAQETPAQWTDELGRLLEAASDPKAPNPRLAQALVTAIGHRRLPLGAAVMKAAGGAIADPVPYLWTLGRLNEPTAEALLLDHMQSSDPLARRQAFLSAMLLGMRQPIAQLRSAAQEESWPAVPLALSRRSQALALIQSMAERLPPSADLLLGLGLRGLPDGVEALLQGLEGPWAQAAAAGLYLLSGAEVSEDVPSEPAANAEGDAGAAGDDNDNDNDDDNDNEQTGIEVTRLSQKPDQWRAWWQDNAQQFTPGTRYRFGRPYDQSAATDHSDAPHQSDPTDAPDVTLLPRLRWLPRDIRQIVADDLPQPVSAGRSPQTVSGAHSSQPAPAARHSPQSPRTTEPRRNGRG